MATDSLTTGDPKHVDFLLCFFVNDPRSPIRVPVILSPVQEVKDLARVKGVDLSMLRAHPTRESAEASCEHGLNLLSVFQCFEKSKAAISFMLESLLRIGYIFGSDGDLMVWIRDVTPLEGSGSGAGIPPTMSHRVSICGQGTSIVDESLAPQAVAKASHTWQQTDGGRATSNNNVVRTPSIQSLQTSNGTKRVYVSATTFDCATWVWPCDENGVMLPCRPNTNKTRAAGDYVTDLEKNWICCHIRHHVRKLGGEMEEEKLVLEALSRRRRKHASLLRAVEEGNTVFKKHEQVTLDEEASYFSRWQSNPYGRRWVAEKVRTKPDKFYGMRVEKREREDEELQGASNDNDHPAR